MPGKRQKRTKWKSPSRRKVLKGLGAGATVSLAGCSGGGDGGDGGGGDGGDGGGGDGGGTVGDPQDGGKTITYILEAPGKGVEKALNNIKSRYEDETGNTLEFGIPPAGQGVGNRLSKLVSAGNPPEIIQCGQGKLARFYSQGVVRPITPAYDAVADRYSDVSRASKFLVEGEEYGIPIYHQRGINWKRNDVWETSPSTWEEEEAMAKEKDNPDGLRGYFVGLKPGDACVNLGVQGVGYQNGCRSFTKKNGEIKVAINNGSNRDRWIELFEHMKTLHEYSPAARDAGCAQMSNSVASGVSSAQWYVGFRPPLKANRQERPYADQVKTYRAVGQSGLEKKDYGSSIVLASAKGSDTQAANDFLKFIFKENNITEYLMGVPIHNIPPFPEIIESEDYQSQLQEIVSESAFTMETVNNFFDTLDEGLSPVTEVEPFNRFGGIPYQLGHYGQALAEVVAQGKDPEVAVENLHNKTKEAVAEAKE